MLKKLKGLFTNTKFDLDNDGKIESYREEIKGVFSQFTRMSNQLDSVNAKLKEVIEDETFAKECEQDNLERIIEEAKRKIKEADERIASANQTIESNNKLKAKVNEFIA